MSLRDLAGRSWQDVPLPEAESGGESLPPSFPASPTGARHGGSDEVTPNSSRSHSPRPVTPSADDVMKLPRKDMHIFGLCPVQDDFILVVCDYCNSSVKMEAFSSHVKLRHGLRAANVKSQIAKLDKNLSRQCTVELSKEDVASLSKESSISSLTTSTSTSGSTSGRSSPVSKPTASGGVKKQTEKELNLMRAPTVEPMEVDGEVPDSTVTSSSSNNVISIPDTEPLPHTMSGDLMAIMGEPAADSTTPSVSFGPSSGGPGQKTINLKVSGDAIMLAQSPKSSTTPDIHSEKVGEVKAKPKRGSEGRKVVREYHPDKHCGVWDEELKRHCTRALTCKSHSVLLKRKIQGRSKTFDELVAAHKKAQAAASAAAAATSPSVPPQVTPTVSVVVSATATAPLPSSPVIQQHVPQVTPVTQVPPVAPSLINQTTIIHPNIQINVPPRNPTVRKGVSPSPLAPSGWADENLHYTTDHPKPLAVCTFGGRRIGGLLIADRSQFLTRKLVRVAITSQGGIARFQQAGFHRIKPRVAGLSLADQQIGLIKGGGIIKRTQGGNLARALQPPALNVDSGGSYLLNYNNLSVKRANISVNPGGGVVGSPQGFGGAMQPGGLHSANTVIPAESFKTDIQDFKGGLKFERGRKIKHILPSGSEITK